MTNENGSSKRQQLLLLIAYARNTATTFVIHDTRKSSALQAFQIFCLCQYFQKIGNISCFPCFSCFPWRKKKRGKPGKKLFDKNGPVESVTTSTSCTFHIHVCRAMYVMYIRQTLIPYLLVGAVLRTRLRSHSELFVVVVFFADYSTKKNLFFVFFQQKLHYF